MAHSEQLRSRPEGVTAIAIDAEHRAALDALHASFKELFAAQRRLRGREIQQKGELSFAQHRLLRELVETDALSTGQLAVAAGLAPATVTQMLDHLEREGVVERARSETDRRVVTTTVTPRGRELLREKDDCHRAEWDRTLADLEPDDARTAAAVLDRLSVFLDRL